MTENEHIARAMLLGMHYHHGNGDPLYYRVDEDGIPEPASFLDANTLKPLMDYNPLGRELPSYYSHFMK